MKPDLPPGTDHYFETIQPEWKKLPFTSEVVNLYWRFPEVDDITTVDPVVEAGVESKASAQRRFLRALDLIDDSDGLTLDGVWLATMFQSPAQSTLSGVEAPLGRKDSLSESEREAYRGLLIGHHWLPMLATTHQLVEEQIPSKQPSTQQVKSFARRLEGIEAYSDLSEGAWETRVKVHYNWFQSIGFAQDSNGVLTLSDEGDDFHDQVEQYYPSQWTE